MVVQPLTFELVEQLLIGLIHEVPNLFEHRDGVGFLLGVLANLDQHVKQLVHVREVEVAGDHEVAGAPVVLPQERVAVLDIVLAKRAVAQVPQEQLAGEGVVVLKRHRVLELLGGKVLEAAHDLAEQVLDGARVHRAHSGDVALAGIHVQLDVGQPRAVLAAVVLLFHQQVHLVEAVKRRAVLVNVVLQRLFESEHGDATLVLKEIAHPASNLVTISP